jgi:resuscitation-promoting factor RpfB
VVAVADRSKHRARNAVATTTAMFVGLAALGVAFSAEPRAGAETARRARPTAVTAKVPLDAAVAARARAEAEQAMLVQAVKDQQLQAWYAAAAQRYARHTSVNWDGIARCETGGNWSMRGATFSGGLGFYNGTWNSFGGREFAPNAGMASRDQQIVVAERVYARYGLSGWGCRAYG